MDVGLPRCDQDLPDPIKNLYALWVRDALEVAYDQVCNLHPFFVHRLDVGPICLTSIAHAFNYRIAVLRDGVKSPARIGRSRRAARQILEDVDIPWDHEVAVMFQVVCALDLEVPGVLLELRCLNGVSPNVVLACELWGHIDHCNEGCECLSSDHTGAYVHDLSLASCDVSPVSREPVSWRGVLTGWGVGTLGCWAPGFGTLSVTSTRGYGRLLLAVYVWWHTGLLVASDWLRPLMRGGGAGMRLRQSQRWHSLTSAD